MIKKCIKSYFVGFSVIAHLIVLLVIGDLLAYKVTTHWRWPEIKRWVFGNVDKTEVFSIFNGDFSAVPVGRWTKIHQQKPSDDVYFQRQEHGGSAFDPYRGRLILFGSNTHGEDWNNSVYTFDMHRLQWNALYPADLPETYSINTDGIPVAGKYNNHPWAMHTFGALVFDPLEYQLVLASFPDHLKPSSFKTQVSEIWEFISKHPTWVFDLQTHTWEIAQGESMSFFAYCMAYDTDLNRVVGFRPNGIFEWKNSQSGWEKIGNQGVGEWHTNAVYDSRNRVFILYGGNKMMNNVHVFQSKDQVFRTMPTIGNRPPADQSVPMVFHEKIGKAVAVIDGVDEANTWLYDYAKDEWQMLEGGQFPYTVGMNYTMEYDSERNLIVFVSSPKNEETAVWVLKL